MCSLLPGRMPVDQQLLRGAQLPGPVARLDPGTGRVLQHRHEDLCRGFDRGIVTEPELVEAASAIEGALERRACRCPRVRPHEGSQAPAPESRVHGIVLLIPAEDGQILAIPLVAARVRVVRGVVPDRAVQEVRLDRAEAALERRDLGTEIPCPVGAAMVEVKGDAELPQQDRRPLHALGSAALQVRELRGHRPSHRALPHHELPRAPVVREEREKPLCRQQDPVIPVRRKGRPGELCPRDGRGPVPCPGLDKDHRARVCRADLPRIPQGKGPEEILREVHRPAVRAGRSDRAAGARASLPHRGPTPRSPARRRACRRARPDPGRVHDPAPPPADGECPHLPHADFLRDPCPERHALQGGGPVAEGDLAPRPLQVRAADVARQRLVQRVVADHVLQAREPLRDAPDSGDVVTLEELLRRLPFHGRAGGEGAPAEEQREHRRGSELPPVRGPDHRRQGIAMELVGDRGPCLVQVGKVEPHCLESPARCAVTSRKPAPRVLVGVDHER